MRLVAAALVTVVTSLAAAACGGQDPWLLRAEHHRVASLKAWAIDDYDRAAREAWKSERAARRAVRGAPVPRVL